MKLSAICFAFTILSLSVAGAQLLRSETVLGGKVGVWRSQRATMVPFNIQKSTYPYVSTAFGRVASTPGTWRIEVSSSVGARSDFSFHVLSAVGRTASRGPIAQDLGNDGLIGVRLLDLAVFFSRDERLLRNAEFVLDGEEMVKILIFDLESGAWSVRRDNVVVSTFVVTDEGQCIFFEGAPGTYSLELVGQENVIPWDVNEDGEINLLDLMSIAQHFGRKVDDGKEPPWEAIGDDSLPDKADVQDDGTVDIFDFVLVGRHFDAEYEGMLTTK